MGFFNLGKLLPWKRKDELGLGPDLGLGGMGAVEGQGMGLGGLGGGGYGSPQGSMPSMPFDQPMQPMPGLGGLGGIPQYPQAQPQPFGASQVPQMEAFQRNQAYERSYSPGKDFEIVSAKLDALKAALDSINQRLALIERYFQVEQDLKRKGGW
ncbi:hypothetical protein HYY73_04190 [Candidatus Woesearchaeota archaeon]|nr:hypothetical protein [Candidatus Woesearchaeota archaeon]